MALARNKASIRTSDRRKHLLNRLKALQANVENLPEDFTLDKKIDRALNKLEGRMRHHTETVNYRKASHAKRLAKAIKVEETRIMAEDEITETTATDRGGNPLEVPPIEIVPDTIATPGLRNIEEEAA